MDVFDNAIELSRSLTEAAFPGGKNSGHPGAGSDRKADRSPGAESRLTRPAESKKGNQIVEKGKLDSSIGKLD